MYRVQHFFHQSIIFKWIQSTLQRKVHIKTINAKNAVLRNFIRNCDSFIECSLRVHMICNQFWLKKFLVRYCLEIFGLCLWRTNGYFRSHKKGWRTTFTFSRDYRCDLGFNWMRCDLGFIVSAMECIVIENTNQNSRPLSIYLHSVENVNLPNHQAQSK